MNWGTKQRLEFIEFRLFWEGKINRKDLIETFNVSIPQASADIKSYRKQAPENIYYDKSLRQYLTTSKFSPIFKPIDANQYLSKLHLLSTTAGSEDEFMMGFIPQYSVLPSLERVIDPYFLRKILKTIRDKKAINVEYQSMSRPSPIWRWLVPHAFAFDGFRWHVRAFCELNQDFRDFILGRILNVESTKNTKISSSSDFKWNHQVTLKIAPNPNLSPDQKLIIEKEYGMVNGIAKIKVRAAFVYYILLRLRLEKPEDKRFLKNMNTVLLNYKEIEEFI